MTKCCLNCEYYLKVEGNTPIGKVYFCNPRISKKLTSSKIENYSCDKYKLKYNLTQDINDLFGNLSKITKLF